MYRADAERLWRAIYAFAGDAEIASDAVAEAFAQVLNRGAAVRDPGRLDMAHGIPDLGGCAEGARHGQIREPTRSRTNTSTSTAIRTSWRRFDELPTPSERR